MKNVKDMQFSQMAVALKFITSEQLATILVARERNKMENIAISDWLLQNDYLTPSQITAVYNQCAEKANEQKTQSETRPKDETQVESFSPCLGAIKETNRQQTEVLTSFGRYRIIAEIGRGGMGRVYKAYDPELDRMVALKVLLAGNSAKTEDIARFLREARATACLRHPHIVNLYDMGNEAGQNYFTMEFITGTSLKSLAQKKLLSIYRIVEIMSKVGKAVHYAHEQGIVHRDLKPANVMLDESSNPKVMDFGLAKVAREREKLSRSGMVMGTLQYMPPEQANGRSSAVDARSDVYSLGATLYECLTGFPPFSGASSINLIFQIMNKEPLAPRHIRKRIPRDLESICLKALEKDKVRRYRSAEEFSEDLMRFSHGDAITARSMGVFRRLGRKIKHNKVIAILIVFFIVAMLFLIWNLHVSRREAQQRERLFQQARKKESAGKFLSALSLYGELLKEDQQNKRSLEKMIHCIETWAAGAILKHDWKTLDEVKKWLQGFIEANRKQKELAPELLALVDRIRSLEVGKGTFQIRVENNENPYFLYDNLKMTIQRISPETKYSLYCREYTLFSFDSAHAFHGANQFEFFPWQKLEFDLRTVSVHNLEELDRALSEAKAGWHIRLAPGIYDIDLVLGPSCFQITLEGEVDKQAIITGEILLLKTQRIAIRNLSIASYSGVKIKDCKDITLDGLKLGCARNYGIKVEHSIGVNVSGTSFAQVGKFVFLVPLYAIGYSDCTGGRLAYNTIGALKNWAPHRVGLDIVRCRNLLLVENEIIGSTSKDQPWGDFGIRLVDTMASTIARNRCSNKVKCGIFARGSTSTCNFIGNICQGNRQAGIMLSAGNYFWLHSNVCRENGVGIAVEHTDNVNITQNWITGNKVGLRFDNFQAKINSDYNFFWKNGCVGTWKRKAKNPQSWQEQINADRNSRLADPQYREVVNGIELPRERPDGAGPVWPGFTDTGVGLWPVPFELAAAGYPRDLGKIKADTIRFQPASRGQYLCRYDEKESVLYLPLPHLRSSDLQPGQISDGELALDGKSDGSGTIAIIPLPFHSYDSIQTVKIYAAARAPRGISSEKAIAFQYRCAEKRGLWKTWKNVRVCDLEKGSYLLPDISFQAGWRPTYIEIRWPEKQKTRAATAKLKYVEIKVNLIDIGSHIFENHQAEWKSTQINGKRLDQGKTFTAKSGEHLTITVDMVNTGSSIWLPQRVKGAAVKMRFLDFQSKFLDAEVKPISQNRLCYEIPLENIVFPLHTATFSKTLISPWKPGDYVVKWQLLLEYVGFREQRWFGPPVEFTLHIDPDEEGRAKASDKLEGKFITLLDRTIWKVENGRLRLLVSPYTQADYNCAEKIDPYLIKGMPQGKLLEKMRK